jgi:hypothetical protein
MHPLRLIQEKRQDPLFVVVHGYLLSLTMERDESAEQRLEPRMGQHGLEVLHERRLLLGWDLARVFDVLDHALEDVAVRDRLLVVVADLNVTTADVDIRAAARTLAAARRQFDGQSIAAPLCEQDDETGLVHLAESFIHLSHRRMRIFVPPKPTSKIVGRGRQRDASIIVSIARSSPSYSLDTTPPPSVVPLPTTYADETVTTTERASSSVH